eukprot:2300972-Prymnesium_polylepis.1
MPCEYGGERACASLASMASSLDSASTHRPCTLSHDMSRPCASCGACASKGDETACDAWQTMANAHR